MLSLRLSFLQQQLMEDVRWTSGELFGTVKIWNSGTYRVENTLSYALERAWCVALRKDALVAVGFDEGVVAIKVCTLYKPFSQINHPVLARQRRTNFQHGPIWQTNLYP
jgi:hypothetical protein